MNENLNLCEILKDCPKGTKLYSPLYGEVELDEVLIDSSEDYVIFIIVNNGSLGDIGFTKYGKYCRGFEDSECMLFPSKDQRDWSKFTAPWRKKERFDPKTLNPFEKVLVRDSDNDSWCCDLFSHIKEENIGYKYVVSSFFCYRCCIPYNDETKHLVGTTEEAPEYYRYWEE